MYAPGINRAEAMRLINEISLSDVWVTLTGNITTREIHAHSEDVEKAEALIIAYVLANPNIKQKLLEIYEIRKP